MVASLFKRLFIIPSDSLFPQLLRYAFVGGIAFVADFGLLYLLTQYVGLHYQVSACISFTVGLTVNYFLSVSWVFNKDRDKSKGLTEFLIFALVGVVGLGLNALIMYILTDLYGMLYMISKIFSTIVVFGWNFIGRRYTSKKLFLCKNNEKAVSPGR